MSAMGHKLAHQATDEILRARQERDKLITRLMQINALIAELETVTLAVGGSLDPVILPANDDDNVLDLPGWKGARG